MARKRQFEVVAFNIAEGCRDFAIAMTHKGLQRSCIDTTTARA
jgi:hypothetical protein